MSASYVLVAVTLLFAGAVKGVFGVGLPAVSIGLLSLLMPPVEAAMLIVVPTLVTNAWQFLVGTGRLGMIGRFATLLIGVALGTAIGSGFLTSANAALASLALGTVLLLYAVVGLFVASPHLTPITQRWASPLTGLLTGIVNGATGVSAIPLVPYLNSIGLERDELIQAMGLVFMTSMIALAACLARTGHLQIASAGASTLALAPIFVGMYAGQAIRVRLHANQFRHWFFLGLIALGGYCVARALAQLV